MGGGNTRKLFHGYKNPAHYHKRFAGQFDTQDKRESVQSNGHLMRASPLSLIEDEDHRRKAVAEDVSITNPSSISVEATQIYVTALRLALGLRADEARSRLRRFITEKANTVNGELKKCLIDALESDFSRKVNERKTKGWCLHALALSLWSGMHATSFKAGIDWAIRQGGDTDTNAAIVGAVLGAREGERTMLVDADTKSNAETVLSCEAAITSGRESSIMK